MCSNFKVFWAYYYRTPKLVSYNQPNVFCLLFWRLEVQDQGTGRSCLVNRASCFRDSGLPTMFSCEKRRDGSVTQ